MTVLSILKLSAFLNPAMNFMWDDSLSTSPHVKFVATLSTAGLSTVISLIQSDSFPYLLAGLHCLIGLLAAAVAYYKGRNLRLWLFIGLTGGTAALFVALVMKRDRVISTKTGVE